MTVRRTTTSAPTTKATRKGAVNVSAKPVPERAAKPSEVAIMLNDLRPSVDAPHERVE